MSRRGFRKAMQLKGAGQIQRCHGVNNDKAVAMACKAVDFAKGPQPPAPDDPETSPEGIRAAQREVVLEAIGLGHRTADSISEFVVLPVSVVRSRMAEINTLRRKVI